MKKHIRQRPPDSNPVVTMKKMHKMQQELLGKGFVKKGRWGTALEDLERECGRSTLTD